MINGSFDVGGLMTIEMSTAGDGNGNHLIITTMTPIGIVALDPI